ncbi:hypothetical protein AYI70_g344 [Smittium culicis]|uniref:Telomerase activating protein Est1-like N-terminal domain-containing protein n=1 Tax=Smittium culicis TaxID=133412 RepID=A0A1R1YH57_9FUNG|nr:hypothetical protein AYI70_g344 [Smittium culicis]
MEVSNSSEIQHLNNLIAKLNVIVNKIASQHDPESDSSWDQFFLSRFRLQNFAQKFFLMPPETTNNLAVLESFWRATSHSPIQLCRNHILQNKEKLSKAISLLNAQKINQNDYSNIQLNLNLILSNWLDKLSQLLHLSNYFYSSLIFQINLKLGNHNLPSLNFSTNNSISSATPKSLSPLLSLIQASYLYLGDISRYFSLFFFKQPPLITACGKFSPAEQLYKSSILTLPINGGGGHGQLAILSHSSSNTPDAFFWYSQALSFKDIPINTDKNIASLSSQFLHSSNLSSLNSDLSSFKNSNILELSSFLYCSIKSNNTPNDPLFSATTEYFNSIEFNSTNFDSYILFKSSVLLTLTIENALGYLNRIENTDNSILNQKTHLFNLTSLILDSCFNLSKKILSFILELLNYPSDHPHLLSTQLNYYLFSLVVFTDYFNNFLIKNFKSNLNLSDISTDTKSKSLTDIFLSKSHDNLLSFIETSSKTLNDSILIDSPFNIFETLFNDTNQPLSENILLNAHTKLKTASEIALPIPDYYTLFYNSAFFETQKHLDFSSVYSNNSTINISDLNYNMFSTTPKVVFCIFMSRFYMMLSKLKTSYTGIEIVFNFSDSNFPLVLINPKLKKLQQNMKTMAESRLKVQVQQIKDKLNTKSISPINFDPSASNNNQKLKNKVTSPSNLISPIRGAINHSHLQKLTTLLVIPDLPIWLYHLDKVMSWIKSDNVCVLLTLDVVSQLDLLKKSPLSSSSKPARIALRIIMNILTNRPTQINPPSLKNVNPRTNLNSNRFNSYRSTIPIDIDYSSIVYDFGLTFSDLSSSVALSNGYGLVTQTFKNSIGDLKSNTAFLSSVFKADPQNSEVDPIAFCIDTSIEFKSFLSTCLYYSHYIFSPQYLLPNKSLSDRVHSFQKHSKHIFQTIVIVDDNILKSQLEQFSINAKLISDFL